MAVTHIDTNAQPRRRAPGNAGEMAEVINNALCGAENLVATLRWLKNGERLDAEALEATHQLLYMIEGDGIITLNGKDYETGTGAGVYLGPKEAASIRANGDRTLKLFHLVVPIRDDAD